MRLITSILAIVLILIAVETKTVKKYIKLNNFHKEGPFIFLTKFHLGVGNGHMKIEYHKNGQVSSQSFYNDVSVGMINSKLYSQFSQLSTCSEKAQFLKNKHKMNFKQQRQGTKHINIYDLQEQQIWYFYLFSCNTNLDELKNNDEQIKFYFGVLNNGSHFGQNQKLLPAYIFIFIFWIFLILKFALPMANLLNLKNPNAIKLIVYGGLILLGVAYLYRLIHFLIYYGDGSGVHMFQILYFVLKNIGQAIMTTAIVSVSWGWSIIHVNTNQYYVIIGVLAGIINIVSLILASLTEQHQQLFHHYDTAPGIIILVLRFIIFFVFSAGIINCLNGSSGKIIYFIKKLGLLGGAYLLSWPMTVLIVQYTLPQYMHRQVITFVQQFVHISTSTLICHMISQPESAYLKVSLNDDDNPLRMGNYKTK